MNGGHQGKTEHHCPGQTISKLGANLAIGRYPAGIVIGGARNNAWAEQRAREALAGLPLRFGRVLHPSPASPAANRGWSEAATRQLVELGVW